MRQAIGERDFWVAPRRRGLRSIARGGIELVVAWVGGQVAPPLASGLRVKNNFILCWTPFWLERILGVDESGNQSAGATGHPAGPGLDWAVGGRTSAGEPAAIVART